MSGEGLVLDMAQKMSEEFGCEDIKRNCDWTKPLLLLTTWFLNKEEMRKPFRSIQRTFTNSCSACPSLFLFSQAVTEITDTTFLSHQIMCFFPNLRFLKHLHVYGLTLPEAAWNLDSWQTGGRHHSQTSSSWAATQQMLWDTGDTWTSFHLFSSLNRDISHYPLTWFISWYLMVFLHKMPQHLGSRHS